VPPSYVVCPTLKLLSLSLTHTLTLGALPCVPQTLLQTRFMEAVRPDDAEAVRWFLHASARGDPDAQCKLGSMYGGARPRSCTYFLLIEHRDPQPKHTAL